jgi:uncharacterized protein (DUF433 family)
MAEQVHRIVSGEESNLHDEPHIAGSRMKIRTVHAKVEQGDLRPQALTDRHNLDVADVYHALAYYHEHPDEMRELEQRRADIIETAREQATTGPADLK